MTPRELIGRRQSCYFANSQSSIFEREDAGQSGAGTLIGSGGVASQTNKNSSSNAEIQNGGGDIPADIFPSAAAEIRGRGDAKSVRHVSGQSSYFRPPIAACIPH